MDTKQLLAWAFEIVLFAKEFKEDISEIKIYRTEEYHFGKDYFRINFRVMDDISFLVELEGYEKLKTEKTQRQNKACHALNRIDNYKSFYAMHYSKQIVDVHYNWILTILNSLALTHQLDLKILHTNDYE